MGCWNSTGYGELSRALKGPVTRWQTHLSQGPAGKQRAERHPDRKRLLCGSQSVGPRGRHGSGSRPEAAGRSPGRRPAGLRPRPALPYLAAAGRRHLLVGFLWLCFVLILGILEPVEMSTGRNIFKMYL